ncbi:uncharacterized protein DUF664 [Asanoa ferruginea]|uniref:Uncharacterized protein DUF664 n=2 Tax=Asanoa ferruginea TaxID=53367 RepID=A0A3D9ZUY4_9ACTN|nr:uncharacterized protein DUF664 [Asanoa ferruginea]GIF51902.1 hypothetical protein Afe04nite_64410 [Asanoa ferruginea]
MFVSPDEDPRSDKLLVSERENLVGYLSDYRLTLELKCAGLHAEQLATRSVPPSDMSLLGLIRHLAGVEHYWFRVFFAREDQPRLFRSDGHTEWDVEPDPAMVDEAWRTWREQVAFAERYVADAPNLEIVGKDGGNLRSVLIHMIEEYARHMGHADFLRERIDGRVGQ